MHCSNKKSLTHTYCHLSRMCAINIFANLSDVLHDLHIGEVYRVQTRRYLSVADSIALIATTQSDFKLCTGNRGHVTQTTNFENSRWRMLTKNHPILAFHRTYFLLPIMQFGLRRQSASGGFSYRLRYTYFLFYCSCVDAFS